MTEQLFFQFDAYNDPDDHYAAQVGADQTAEHTGVCTAVVEATNGLARSARTDQFYHKDGFLEIRCSEDLPALTIAAALLAALQIVAPETDKKYGETLNTQAASEG